MHNRANMPDICQIISAGSGHIIAAETKMIENHLSVQSPAEAEIRILVLYSSSDCISIEVR